MKAEQLEGLAANLRVVAHDIYSGSARPLDAETVALAAVVLGEQARALAMTEAVPEPEPEPAPAGKRKAGGKRAPKGQGAHRHKFDADGQCNCGARRMRAPKGSAKPLDAAARTAPLPLGGPAVPRPIGDDVPDKFDGGAFGSSSTRER
jgi:hypothetical protein